MTAELEEAARIVAGGGVVVLTGAGMSEEAGIPTFRDPGGLWDRFDPSDFGTWQGLAGLASSRPDELAEFLAALRRALAAARPSPGHRAVARLEEAGLVEAVVTQNVDGLHQEAGSRRVLEIHGSFLRNRCLACGRADSVSREEVCVGLDRAVVGLRQAFVPSFESLLPKCSSCGGPTRPDFVAFGELLRDFEQAEELAARCRVLLAVGTSGEVYPAASLPETAREAGASVVGGLGPHVHRWRRARRGEGWPGAARPRRGCARSLTRPRRPATLPAWTSSRSCGACSTVTRERWPGPSPWSRTEPPAWRS